MAELKYWVWFSNSVGNHRVAATELLESVGGDPEEIYKMSREALKGNGLDSELVTALANKDLKAAEKEIKIAEKYNIRLLSRDNEDYPDDLRAIDDAPYVLYMRGTSDETGDGFLRIGIVGSRRCSDYGIKVAYELAYSLAKRGVIIVSGMATGIDAQAHKGAVDAGGKTIAVLGCGVNLVYPKDNAQLMVDIMKNGQVISEFPFDTPPYRWNFPQRNRMISGLSHGLIVVEAEEVSGTSITAGLALEQGKELFAVPGNINSPTSVGTNRLIKNGATPVTCVADVLELFEGFDFEPEEPEFVPENEEQPVTGLSVSSEDGPMPEQIILESIRTDALTVDEISVKTGLPLPQVSGIMTVMEISGLVDAVPGHKYIKTSKIS